jgi:hypothetical protein
MKIAPHAIQGKAQGAITRTWKSQANLALFLALLVVVVFVFPSLGLGAQHEPLYSAVAFSVLLFLGIAIAWGQRWLFIFSLCVGAIALAVRWISLWRPTPRLSLWSDACTAAAVVAITLILLRQVFRSGPVTAMRIQGAIAIYLCFGMAWASAYHMVESLVPGSFRSMFGGLHAGGEFVFYSFVTLTSVGYGDIVPVGQIARSLSILEVLTGQLFLAVTIARLVALQIVDSERERSNNDSA